MRRKKETTIYSLQPLQTDSKWAQTTLHLSQADGQLDWQAAPEQSLPSFRGSLRSRNLLLVAEVAVAKSTSAVRSICYAGQTKAAL